MCQISQGRGTLAKSLREIKERGVPVGKRVEDYFVKGSVHHALLTEGQRMVHSHEKSEYWTHCDAQGRPIIGMTQWGKYFSTHVLLGASGGSKGRNSDQVTCPYRALPLLSPAPTAPCPY